MKDYWLVFAIIVALKSSHDCILDHISTVCSVSVLSFIGHVGAPTFENIKDQKIREAKAGQQIMIIGSVRNDIYLDENKSMTLLVEVRDQDDVTIYLAWQSGRVSPNDTFSFGTSWTVPNDAVIGSVYKARTFALTYIGDEAEPLSTVLENQITTA